MPTKPKNHTCTKCNTTYPLTTYYTTTSPFFPLSIIPICPYCLQDIVPQEMNAMDKFCQWADWPFYPDRWFPLSQNRNHLDQYYKTVIYFDATNYDGHVDWRTVNDQWRELERQDTLISLSPLREKQEEKRLREFWEFEEKQYTLPELRYLEQLYRDIERTQNVGTGTQTDQAKKLARLSLDMDIAQRQSQLELYTKLMRAYVDLIRVAEFTPKSSTSATSFESMGELVAFLEKTGFINRFYDGEERDIVDKTIKNQQMFLRRIVSGESTLSERVEQRLQRMELLDRMEDGMTAEEEWSYDLAKDDDWVDNDTFTVNDIDNDEEEFAVDLDPEQ